MSLAKCPKCGWYHFEVSRVDAEKSAEEFDAYFRTLTEEDRQKYYGSTTNDPADSIKRQERCFGCGASYKDMVDDDGKCPIGVTVQGIIRRDQ